MGKSKTLSRGWTAVLLVTILSATISCSISVTFLLWGLIREGPAFYNGQECRMTYSHYQFLPLRVLLLPSKYPSSTTQSSSSSSSGRYRLLKFADKRDPRHAHFHPVSGSMVENYESQHNDPMRNKTSGDGRLLEVEDNWCLLDRDALDKKDPAAKDGDRKWKDAPHPHRGHPVLYVPGHWGSFSQARSLGALGTRWTGPYAKPKSDQEIYESLFNGEGMHDGSIGALLDDDTATSPVSSEDFMDWFSSSSQQQHQLDGFVMDVFALDFDGQGAALHSSKLLRQAEFFARAVETIVEGCHLSNNSNDDDDAQQQRGITIVAHSIGAWVVRIALKMHPHLSRNGWVRNVVTLASPLGSVPYAVDSGIHDIAQHINDDNGHDEGDVTMISISGGLRDEMIPPEMCQVPPASNNTYKTDKDGAFVSNAFLASSIVQQTDGGSSSASSNNDQFGMDHRAIVWCYDLLKVVREVIFSLAVATDRGLSSSQRMRVAKKIMYRGKVDFGDRKGSKESNMTSYRESVNDQHVRLLQEKGYWRTVSIQLSAPYHLNTLLKLCIVASLLHIIAIFPICQYLRRCQSRPVITRRSLTETCFDMALGLIGIPILILMVIWTRQLDLSSFGWGILPACYGQECQLLAGTSFVLSQLATLIYFLIVHGVCSLVAVICNKCFTFTEKNSLSLEKSFGGILLQICMQQLRIFAVVLLPLTTAGCYVINTTLIPGNEHCAWNRMAMASYIFISFLILVLVHLVTLACKSSPENFEQRRSFLLVLFLSLVKATFGKAMYAFSLTTHWGQSGLDSYDDFLSAINSNAGVIGGHHNEMTMCVLTILLPAFSAAMAIRTHDIMAQTSTRYWNKSKQLAGNNEDTANGSEIKHKATPQYNEPKFITVAHACFICWFTWNVSVNFPADNIIVPVCSSIVVVTIRLRSLPFSFEVMDACSEILKNHDKNE